ARNSPLLRCLSVIRLIRSSRRVLPIEVMTKQLDCWTIRRTIGSIVVIWVFWTKAPHQTSSRPSSTARVPSVSSQRSRLASAPTLVPPAAAPVTGPLELPCVTQPVTASRQDSSSVERSEVTRTPNLHLLHARRQQIAARAASEKPSTQADDT